MNSKPPRWDLSIVYPGLESKEFKADMKDFEHQVETMETLYLERVSGTDAGTSVRQLGVLLGEVVGQINAAKTLSATLNAYIYSFFSTDSHNMLARRLLSEYEQVKVRLQKMQLQFQAWMGRIAPVLDEAIAQHETSRAHAFYIKEIAEQSKYLMGGTEEALAAELNLSGASAWEKLQSTIVSQQSVDFELDGKTQKLPITAVINLHSHPDESVRRRAYEAEMGVWESVREPLAACMNGIKGAVNTLNKRRGREDALHASIDIARINRSTLEAMLSAMSDSFPVFRRYLQAKAKKLGKQGLAWWDIYAPTGKTDRTYSFDEARALILENFGKFSPELRTFAEHAFDNHWIDSEQREGKQGGAFSMDVPKVKECRILSNFDGSLDQVSTIAHELGHAFHSYCGYQAGKTELQMTTPMTMAETASIMCETVVMEAILAQAANAQEQLGILDSSLINSTQIIVDIYSRYLFEKEVFERREKAELSSDDLCEIMQRAQKATYGEGLDERYLHKYMWSWKPHYYSADLSFYNYPYSFGLLFGLGLYAIYLQRGVDFLPDYKDLLASTGEATAADLASRFGIDICGKKFWEDSLKVVGKQIDRYCTL